MKAILDLRICRKYLIGVTVPKKQLEQNYSKKFENFCCNYLKMSYNTNINERTDQGFTLSGYCSYNNTTREG